MAIRTVMLAVATLVGAVNVGAGEPAPSPLAAHSFPIYWMSPGAATGLDDPHRGVLVFSRDGASCDLFPNGIRIPYQGTLKTTKTGRKGSTISAFSATGSTAYAGGTISFTARKDGAGASGTVTVTAPGRAPIQLRFAGQPPPPMATH